MTCLRLAGGSLESALAGGSVETTLALLVVRVKSCGAARSSTTTDVGIACLRLEDDFLESPLGDGSLQKMLDDGSVETTLTSLVVRFKRSGAP
jgi:hypothetical protein